MKECKTCGELFEPTREWSMYCSEKCRNNSPNKKKITSAYQQARREAINKIKTDAGCSVCGYNEHPAALDFNHVRGEKLFNISQDPKKAWGDILAEIEKCEVLCSNCHRIHTYEHRHWHTKRRST